MTPILVATLALMAPATEPSGATSTTPVVSAVPAANSTQQRCAPHELRQAIRAALGREATSKGAEKREAVRELVELYRTLDADRQMAADQREEYLGKMRSRLMNFARQTSAQIVAARRQAQGGKDGDAKQLPASVESGGESRHILAQQFAGQGGAFGGGVAGAPGGNQQEDDGEALVELIQKVIAPQHWEVNGGPGSIVYYGSLRVLIIRASDDVHAEIGDVMDNLRRIGP